MRSTPAYLAEPITICPYSDPPLAARRGDAWAARSAVYDRETAELANATSQTAGPLALVLTLDQTRSYLAACAAGTAAQWWAKTMPR
jgi:hypothetical protein